MLCAVVGRHTHTLNWITISWLTPGSVYESSESTLLVLYAEFGRGEIFPTSEISQELLTSIRSRKDKTKVKVANLCRHCKHSGVGLRT